MIAQFTEHTSAIKIRGKKVLSSVGSIIQMSNGKGGHSKMWTVVYIAPNRPIAEMLKVAGRSRHSRHAQAHRHSLLALPAGGNTRIPI